MDLKLKIILILFICILIGFTIFFIISQFQKQKKNELQEKALTESFENYDLRQFILQQLDKFKLDQNKKSAIYDSLSNKIDDLKDMPQQKLESFIREVVNDSKKIISSSRKNEDMVDKELQGTYSDKETDLSDKKTTSRNVSETYDNEDDYDIDTDHIDDIKEHFENNNEMSIKTIEGIISSLDNAVRSVNTAKSNLDIFKYRLNEGLNISLVNDTNIKQKNQTPSKSARTSLATDKNVKTQPTTNSRTRNLPVSNSSPSKPTSSQNSRTRSSLRGNTSTNTQQSKQPSVVDNEENVDEEQDDTVEGFKNFGGDWYSYI